MPAGQGLLHEGVLSVKRSVKINKYERDSRAETNLPNSLGGTFGGIYELDIYLA